MFFYICDKDFENIHPYVPPSPVALKISHNCVFTITRKTKSTVQTVVKNSFLDFAHHSCERASAFLDCITQF